MVEKNLIAINKSKNEIVADEANLTQDASFFLKPPVVLVPLYLLHKPH